MDNANSIRNMLSVKAAATLKNPMRILLLTTSFPVSPDSSSGIFVERLARRLGQHCRLHVLAPAASAGGAPPDPVPYRLSTFVYAPARWRLLAHGGGGIPAALGGKPWLMLLVPAFLLTMLLGCLRCSRDVDLIFANWSICGVIGGIVGRIRGVPMVTTVRGEDANRAATSRVHHLLLALCLRMGGRMVTVSEEIAENMREMFPEFARRIVMIPNGVDTLQIDNATESQAGDEAINLITVGSLIPRKSIETLLHAISCLPAKFSLTIVGDGPEHESLRALAVTLGIEGRTNLVGHVHPEQVANWLARADALVITSRSEGRPNAVLEAMAAALPVVGSDIAGIRELVTPGVNGWLFPVGEVDALVDRLLTLDDRTLRHRMGNASRQVIFERGLTWENCARAYLQQFEDVLAEERG